MGFHPYGSAPEADTPQKTAEHHTEYDNNHRQTDFVQQIGHIEGYHSTVFGYGTVDQAVHYCPVELRNDQLHIVHQHKRRHTEKKCGQIAEIITIDMLSEKQGVSPHSMDVIGKIYCICIRELFTASLPAEDSAVRQNAPDR